MREVCGQTKDYRTMEAEKPEGLMKEERSEGPNRDANAGARDECGTCGGVGEDNPRETVGTQTETINQQQ